MYPASFPSLSSFFSTDTFTRASSPKTLVVEKENRDRVSKHVHKTIAMYRSSDIKSKSQRQKSDRPKAERYDSTALAAVLPQLYSSPALTDTQAVFILGIQHETGMARNDNALPTFLHTNWRPRNWTCLQSGDLSGTSSSLM